MTPAQALATILARLLRRRRGEAEPVAEHHTPPAKPRGKAIHIYGDKSRRAGRDYEIKAPGGTEPHG